MPRSLVAAAAVAVAVGCNPQQDDPSVTDRPGSPSVRTGGKPPTGGGYDIPAPGGVTPSDKWNDPSKTDGEHVRTGRQ